MLPFISEQFPAVFANHITAIWPLRIGVSQHWFLLVSGRLAVPLIAFRNQQPAK